MAPSATAWLARRGRRRGDGRTVLVAGPGNQRGPSEVRAIAGRRPGATVLTGAGATPAATLAAIDGAAVAHLATHGRHEAQNALFSSLELHGGPVLGYDLQRLEEPPELVVLAGCELGLSEVRPGDESFGMASALLAAGTATVIASVCRVADEAASEAMVGLHRRLAAGRTPAEALAQAAAGTGFVCLGR
ncbi:CHAT domain-containing protein [Actinoplanes sp. NPDC051411]|uniref:CHAT domain-containing protein n=1 Tax=Actinoplanes sp. NPDC051411 TaxID=3155522 RepID=UPI0034360347